jgi:hypothetical protein
MLFDLAGDFPQPVRIRKLIEEQLRPLFVRRLRALVDRRAFVRLEVSRELVDRLETHGAKVAGSG